MTKKELKKLRSKLPRGYVRMLMNETGVSTATISRVLKGVSPNKVVLDAAIKLASAQRSVEECLSHKIKSL